MKYLKSYIFILKNFKLFKLSKNKDEYFPREINNSNMESIEKKFLLMKYNDDKEIDTLVPPKTWNDLEMTGLFKVIDTCISPLGSQFLYEMMRYQETDKLKLKEKSNVYSFFQRNDFIKKTVDINLKRITNSEIFNTTSFFLKDLPQPKFNDYFIMLLPLLFVIFLGLTIFANPKFGIILIIISLFNLIIRSLLNTKINQSLESVNALNKILITSLNISEIEGIDIIPQVREIKRYEKKIKSYKKKSKWLMIDKFRTNEVVLSLIEYFNVFCLIDYISLLFSLDDINKNVTAFKKVIMAVASIDAHISISNFIANKVTSEPVFSSKKEIITENIYHPSLKEAVTNSIHMNKSILITGSNMSGKSTFIKAVGINIVLALTLNVVFAKKIHLPINMAIRTSIKNKDDLNKGESFYYAELEELKEFIHISKRKWCFFIVDEILKGTNTIERIAISSAILSSFGKSSLVLATTHDVELTKILSNSYKMYHFQEYFQKNDYYFDYLIKEGTSLHTNAINLLHTKGFPLEVIQKSSKLADLIKNHLIQDESLLNKSREIL